MTISIYSIDPMITFSILAISLTYQYSMAYFNGTIGGPFHDSTVNINTNY